MLQLDLSVTDKRSGGFATLGNIVIRNVGNTPLGGRSAGAGDGDLRDYLVTLHEGRDRREVEIRAFNPERGAWALVEEALGALAL